MFSPFKSKKYWANIPDDTCLVAIGDIHGRLDKLDEILDQLESKNIQEDQRHLVFLGDYIDRGPDSAGVLNRLIDEHFLKGWQKHYLMGNHEELMLNFLDEGDRDMWLKWGGQETVASYGIHFDVDEDDHTKSDKMNRFTKALPKSHIDFLRTLKLTFEMGDFLFVHAGVNPNKDLINQSRSDFLWIRKPFMDSNKRFEKMIVHGHTPLPKPEHRKNRIGIDTGCGRGGTLSAVILKPNKIEFLTV